jgi:hypothetical protein
MSIQLQLFDCAISSTINIKTTEPMKFFKTSHPFVGIVFFKSTVFILYSLFWHNAIREVIIPLNQPIVSIFQRLIFIHSNWTIITKSALTMNRYLHLQQTFYRTIIWKNISFNLHDIAPLNDVSVTSYVYIVQNFKYSLHSKKQNSKNCFIILLRKRGSL